MNETLLASKLESASTEMSIAHRVRNHLGSLETGVQFTSRSIADAIAPGDTADQKIFNNTSVALSKAAAAGYIEVVEVGPNRANLYRLTKAKDWETRPRIALKADKLSPPLEVVDEKVHGYLQTLMLHARFTPTSIGERIGWHRTDEIHAIGKCLERGKKKGFLRVASTAGRFITYELIGEVGKSPVEAAEALFKPVVDEQPITPPPLAAEPVSPPEPKTPPTPLPQPVLAVAPAPGNPAASLMHERLLELAAEMETVRTTLAQYSEDELIEELYRRRQNRAA